MAVRGSTAKFFVLIRCIVWQNGAEKRRPPHPVAKLYTIFTQVEKMRMKQPPFVYPWSRRCMGTLGSDRKKVSTSLSLWTYRCPLAQQALSCWYIIWQGQRWSYYFNCASFWAKKSPGMSIPGDQREFYLLRIRCQRNDTACNSFVIPVMHSARRL